MAILLHFFVEAKDEKSAKVVVSKMRAKVADILTGCRFKSVSFEPYWKIAGWYDAAFRIILPKGQDEVRAERALAEGIAEGWSWFPGGQTAVCTDDRGLGTFKIPKVRWAEVALR